MTWTAESTSVLRVRRPVRPADRPAGRLANGNAYAGDNEMLEVGHQMPPASSPARPSTGSRSSGPSCSRRPWIARSRASPQPSTCGTSKGSCRSSRATRARRHLRHQGVVGDSRGERRRSPRSSRPGRRGARHGADGRCESRDPRAVTGPAGAAALRISVTDAFLAYVREPMRPLLIASGVLLLGLAAWSLWRVSGQAERVEDEAAATAGT
jgi:hypothetical protein